MRKVMIAGVALAVTALLSACGATPTGATEDKVDLANKDPKLGPVFVRSIDSNGYYMTTVKFCDGTTLVFNFIGDSKGGGSALMNSVECGFTEKPPTS